MCLMLKHRYRTKKKGAATRAEAELMVIFKNTLPGKYFSKKFLRYAQKLPTHHNIVTLITLVRSGLSYMSSSMVPSQCLGYS